MKYPRRGFAATGVLYTILVIFLVLMATLIVTFSSRSRILGKLKDEARNGSEKQILIGDKYEIDPGDGVVRTFYVLEVKGDNVSLIMDSNLENLVSWNTASTYLQSQTSNWTKVNVSMPTGQQIANTVNSTTWSKSGTQAVYNLPSWLLVNSSSWGYWTSDNRNQTEAWYVGKENYLTCGEASNTTLYKVRPVITVSKSKLDPNAPDQKFIGIPKSNYNVGDKVSYLGNNWFVMKDNGDNDLLIMDGYLSESELKENLPSDVASSDSTGSIIGTDGMKLCYTGYGDVISETDFLKITKNYCYEYWSGSSPKTNNYSWNKSLVKPILEKWLTNKMASNNLYSERELKVMTFSDGVENSTGYVRLVQEEELGINKVQDGGACQYAGYCPVTNIFAIRNYSYWTMTASGSSAYLNQTESGNFTSIGMSTIARFQGQIVPVINVQEK